MEIIILFIVLAAVGRAFETPKQRAENDLWKKYLEEHPECVDTLVG